MAEKMKNILRAIGYFIIYIMLTILLQGLLSVLFMGIAALKGTRDEAQIIAFANNNILGITVFSGILTIVVFYLIFKIRKKDIKTEWKLNRFDVRELLLPIILSFSYSFLFALITYDMTMENSAMIADSAAWYSGLFPLLGFFMTAVNLLLIAPVSEELVLRGVIYTRIEKTGRPLAAIVISSLLFGCMHIAAGGSILVIGSIFMGAVLGYILYRYDSLWMCMIAHAAANLPKTP
ncbi:MAG: CPBP family intramembrane metalloprotease [Bacteroidales bacterium]|nr:CPBP family intramembrane metalloprotease [Bacteroidales bacterium]MCM1416452.1 CPBP family intramembrane metalloprotease [bacterium]MCM1424427.1 CPBP family intramembrane metalloprotease [bacterium]